MMFPGWEHVSPRLGLFGVMVSCGQALVSLGVAVGTLSEQTAKRIIVVHLLHRAGGIADNTVVAKMVLQIVVIDGSRTVEGDIATVNLYLLQCPSFVYHIPAIERHDICRRGRNFAF